MVDFSKVVELVERIPKRCNLSNLSNFQVSDFFSKCWVPALINFESPPLSRVLPAAKGSLNIENSTMVDFSKVVELAERIPKRCDKPYFADFHFSEFF